MTSQSLALSAESSAEIRNDFGRGERLIVLAGAVALGSLAGVVIALALGRVGLWPIFVGAPLFAFALYLSCATLHDAVERRAYGCAVAAGLVTLSLFAWPLSALFALPLWAGPLATVAAMTLLASCWSGAARAVYRLCGQATIVFAGASYLGVVNLLT